MSFVLLDSFANYIDAHIVLGRMQEENIQCWLKDENTVTLDPILTNAVGGIKLMVAEDQYEKALELLRLFRTEKRNNYACPKCNSHDIERISSPRNPSSWFGVFIGFFTSFALASEHTWHCFQCKAEFEQPLDTSDINTETNNIQKKITDN